MTDKELLNKYITDKDEKAFSQLYTKYHHLVYLVCIKYLKDHAEAQDLSTEIFVKVMKDVSRFDIKNFKSWLLQVTRNACLMFIRDRKHFSVEFEEKYVDQTLDQKDFQSEEEKFNRLDYCISVLSEEQRTCVKLFFNEGLKYQEIENQTGFTFKNIKSFLQNAKRNLKKCMNQI